MALTLPPFSLEVNVSDIASKIVESEAGPVINLGVSLKLSVSELLQALQQYHKDTVEPTEAAVLAAVPPGPVPRPAEPLGFTEDKPGALVLTQLTSGLSDVQNITWDNPIADLQAGREEFAAVKCRWEPIPSSKNWILSDEAPLVQNLKIKGLRCSPLAKKTPTAKVGECTQREGEPNNNINERVDDASAMAIAKTDETRPAAGAFSLVAAPGSPPSEAQSMAPAAMGAVDP